MASILLVVYMSVGRYVGLYVCMPVCLYARENQIRVVAVAIVAFSATIKDIRFSVAIITASSVKAGPRTKGVTNADDLMLHPDNGPPRSPSYSHVCNRKKNSAKNWLSVLLLIPLRLPRGETIVT